MPSYVGFLNRTQRVIIKGATLEEAMANAGYLPRTSTRSGNKLIGFLMTGQRYSFRTTKASFFDMRKRKKKS